jgi:hypothetical protein
MPLLHCLTGGRQTVDMPRDAGAGFVIRTGARPRNDVRLWTRAASKHPSASAVQPCGVSTDCPRAGSFRSKFDSVALVTTVLLLRVEPEEAELMLGALAHVVRRGTAGALRRLGSSLQRNRTAVHQPAL